MSGTATSTAAFTFKRAIYDAAVELWKEAEPDFGVIWGSLGTYVPDAYVQFLGTVVSQEPATQGTNRSREETLELETQWFVTKWGDEDASRAAEEYLYERLGELERYVRMTDTTLGGIVRDCFLTELITDQASYTQNNAAGRLSAAIATFTAHVRVTR